MINTVEDFQHQLKWFDVLDSLAILSKQKKFQADSYSNRGIIYYYNSRYDEALIFLYKALPLAEDLKHLRLQSGIYNFLGIISSDQGNSKKAIYFFRKTYNIAVALKDSGLQARSANNIGVDYNNISIPTLGLYYISICERIMKAQKTYKYIPSIYGNKMESYFGLNDALKAKEQLDSMNLYFKKTDQGIDEQITLNYFSGQYYAFINDHTKAISFLEKNLTIIPASEVQEFRKTYKELNTSYFKLKDYKNAYVALEKYFVYSDSIMALAKLQTASETENNYKNFKTEKELEIQKLNNINKSLQLKRNKAILILVSSLSLLLFAGIFFFYKLFRDKRKANVLLEQQKSEITHQKKEILDSIYYSKRIQEGILPTENELNQKVGEHFVLYKPKDIVSGDFYWACKKIDDSFLIACCDCTGHGVPGAFMSLVAYSLLNKIDEGDQHKNPSEILNYLNIELPKFFKKEDSSQQIKDGMDMSLIEVDRKNLKLNYSGANNSIYLIREGVLQVIKADKHPISADIDMRKYIFKNTELDLKKDDVIVMFTDGFADQFGGPKARQEEGPFGLGKKFMYKRLEELLVKYYTLDLKILNQKLSEELKTWQGNLEQVDDVCLIGIRI